MFQSKVGNDTDGILRPMFSPNSSYPDLTVRKWNPSAATQRAKSDLRHRDIVGLVQQGRGGLGLGEGRPSWKRAAPAQCRRLVVEEVQRQKQATRYAKVVSQAKQGQWMRWEAVERRKFSWRELMGMEAFHTSLILQATYAVLPTRSLSISCKPKTHSGWLQNKPVTRPLHLAAQPRPQDQTDKDQCPAFSIILSSICKRRCKASQSPYNIGHKPAQGVTGSWW